MYTPAPVTEPLVIATLTLSPAAAALAAGFGAALATAEAAGLLAGGALLTAGAVPPQPASSREPRTSALAQALSLALSHKERECLFSVISLLIAPGPARHSRGRSFP